MNAESARRPLVWALLAGPLCLGAALAIALLFDPDVGREIGAYALGTLPLAALAGGLAGSRSRERPSRGPSLALLGALVAMLLAFVAAYLQAAIRFRYLGSTGLVSAAALPYTRESLMQIGVLPAILGFGAVVARRPRHTVGGALAEAAGIGAVGSLLVGPTLLLTATMARVRLLNPVVVAFLVVLVIAFATRPRPS